MPDLNFRAVKEETADTPPPDDGTCHCLNPDDQYTLEIDASSVFLTHTTCGKPVGDWATDALNLPATPVTLQWTVDRNNYTGEVADAWADLAINAPAVQAPATDRAGVSAVRALHQQYAFGDDPQDYCAHCNQITGSWIPWPCPTILAVDAAAAAPAAVSAEPGQADGEQPFGIPGCTCKPWTTEDGKRRFLEPGETVDRISGWHAHPKCPHHQPVAGAQQQPKEA